MERASRAISPPPFERVWWLRSPDEIWRMGVNVFERYNGPYSEEMKPFVEIMLQKRVAVKLEVERVRTWDHRKLGGGY